MQHGRATCPCNVTQPFKDFTKQGFFGDSLGVVKLIHKNMTMELKYLFTQKFDFSKWQETSYHSMKFGAQALYLKSHPM